MLVPSLQGYLPDLAQHHIGVGTVGTLSMVDDSAEQSASIATSIISPSIINNLLSTFDPSQNPTSTILISYVLVTAADMVPFVPCQPLAIALGAKLGFTLAFPITAIGQTTAGILAFTAAREVANSEMVEEAAVSAKLSPEAVQKLQDFRQLTTTEAQGEMKILLALIGLRLAPFFPFSAGNYLLGGTTSVPLKLFVVATLFGCLLSNFVSVSVGAAGGAVLSSDFHII